VARPVSVAETFFNPAVQKLVEVQSMIALLDADLVIDDQADYTDLAYSQIAVADLVVINKTDLVPPSRLESVRKKVENIVPRARIWETTFGEVPLDLIFGDRMSRAAENLHWEDPPHTAHHGHSRDGEFATWTFRSKEKWSFNALQRAVEHLPKGIFRAKGMVCLDLETDDYGVLQVTGRRGWLRLVEPESEEDRVTDTELVFIGKPGATSNEELRNHFEQAWEAAGAQGEEGYRVTDLRAFNVVFA
jgi:G3E family GTPase